MKLTFLYKLCILNLFLLILFNIAVLGQSVKNIESQDTVFTKTIDENKKMNNNELLEQVILFEVIDEKGLAKEYVTAEERKRIEKKVKEFEKNKKISNRDRKIYTINSKLEIVSYKQIK